MQDWIPRAQGQKKERQWRQRGRAKPQGKGEVKRLKVERGEEGGREGRDAKTWNQRVGTRRRTRTREQGAKKEGDA